MQGILSSPATERRLSRRGTYSTWLDWMPLLVLPALAIALMRQREGWVVMWSVAVGIFVACKWITWRTAAKQRRRSWRSAAYFVAWPGLDARAFLDGNRKPPAGTAPHWCSALFKTALGAGLLWYAARQLSLAGELVSGWVGLAGLILLLHCGVLHLVALAWQLAGVAAVPIMRAPLLAASLGDFWGRRWNLAFRDFAHRCVFLPTQRRLGATAAVMTTFLVSGLLHEMVISIPARAGYGLPTAYFILQGLGILVERAAPLRMRTAVGRLAARLFAIALVLGPAWLLFHPPFVFRVMLPFMRAIGAF